MIAPEQMTSNERIVAALEGQPVDRVPWCPFLAYVWENFPQDIQEMGQGEFLKRVGAEPLWRGGASPVTCGSTADDEIETTGWEHDGLQIGQTVTPVGTIRSARMPSPEGNTSFLVEHPLKTEEDFKVWTWIEEHAVFEPNYADVQKAIDAFGSDGLILGMLVPRGKSAYQDMVEHLVGTEELIYAGVDFPDTVHTLWQQMVANGLKAAEIAADCPGLDYYITWEDSGTQNYSPDQYDRFIGSEIGQWCDILAARGKKYIQHACGNVRALVGRMADHGAFAIESISPPPTGDVTIAEARAIIGDRMGIIGGIEPTEFLNLSMQELEPYVRQVIQDASGGPFVLANSDSCPPGVTMEKFKLVGDIVRDP